MSKEGQKQYKRGQKAKLKRIKEKYKDQDEEERRLRLEIIHNAVASKELNPKSKRGKKAKAMEKQQEEEKRRAERAAAQATKQQQHQQAKKQQQKKKEPGEEDEDALEDDEEEEKKESDDLSFLDSFTGQPVAEDELLFALPVVAPYAVLNNYKYVTLLWSLLRIPSTMDMNVIVDYPCPPILWQFQTPFFFSVVQLTLGLS